MGREILRALSADDSWAAVHCVGRRAPRFAHPKLIAHEVDFAALPPVPPVDDVFIALGTTLKAAGSQASFRAVDFEAVVALALAARASGASRLGVISAMGADPHAAVFYSRVKGEMEQAVSRAGYTTVIIARPSLLDGDREALGQPLRTGERLGLALARLIKPLIPARYRPVQARDVAFSLVHAVKTRGPGVHVLPSDELQPR